MSAVSNNGSDRKQRVFVAGHRGMVGSALVRQLASDSAIELVLVSRERLDLCDEAAVQQFFGEQNFDQVYLAAARVGGIKANRDFAGDFIRENLLIQTSVIDAAHRAGVGRLLFLGSSCIYPRLAEQPMKEEALMTGVLEPTNEAYAVAKIAGIKMCEAYRRQYGSDFRSVMPTNLYGPHDNFDLQNSHVLPALLRKFHAAVENGDSVVPVWGSGRPKREFLHVDDMASACIHLMGLPEDDYWSQVDAHCSHINVGTGEDVSISELARSVAEATGYQGSIEYDESMPDGTPRKLLDVSRLHAMGWTHRIPLQAGLKHTLDWMVDNWDHIRK